MDRIVIYSKRTALRFINGGSDIVRWGAPRRPRLRPWKVAVCWRHVAFEALDRTLNVWHTYPFVQIDSLWLAGVWGGGGGWACGVMSGQKQNKWSRGQYIALIYYIIHHSNGTEATYRSLLIIPPWSRLTSSTEVLDSISCNARTDRDCSRMKQQIARSGGTFWNTGQPVNSSSLTRGFQHSVLKLPEHWRWSQGSRAGSRTLHTTDTAWSAPWGWTQCTATPPGHPAKVNKAKGEETGTDERWGSPGRTRRTETGQMIISINLHKTCINHTNWYSLDTKQRVLATVQLPLDTTLLTLDLQLYSRRPFEQTLVSAASF